MEGASGRIFISYAHEDEPAAYEICSTLEQSGFPCWIAPRDVPPGADWPASITRSIETSRSMLIVLTKAANISTHMVREVQLADRRSIPIIPVRLDEVETSGGLAYFLGNRQWLDVFPGPVRDHRDQLVALVGSLASPPPPRTETSPQPAPEGPGPQPPEAPRRPRRARDYFAVAAGLIALLLAAYWLYALVRPSVAFIERFDAAPPVVERGQEVHLDWHVRNAVDVELFGPGVGRRRVGASGAVDVRPDADAVYVLRATGRRGAVERSLRVEVRQPPVPRGPGQPPEVVADETVERTDRTLPGDAILGARLVEIVRDTDGDFWHWNCRLEVEYTYDPRHGEVIVGGEAMGGGFQSGHSYWGTPTNAVEERQEGELKRGVQRVQIAIRLLEPIAVSRQLRLYLYERDPPRTPFITRTFPFEHEFRRP